MLAIGALVGQNHCRVTTFPVYSSTKIASPKHLQMASPQREKHRPAPPPAVSSAKQQQQHLAMIAPIIGIILKKT